jgi:nitroreductase
MDMLKLIKSRRSIRKYKEKIPSDKEIEKILEAGRWAPSGLNNQPWRFMVIKEKEIKEKVASLSKYGYIIKKAPVIIVVCLDKKSSYHYQKDLMAMGACIQNMLLEAHSLGLGACWLGEILNKRLELQALLGLDKNLEITALLTLGYPRERPSSVRLPLEALKIKRDGSL